MDTIPVRQVGIKSLGIREICAHVTAPAMRDVGLALEGSRRTTHQYQTFADGTNLPMAPICHNPLET